MRSANGGHRGAAAAAVTVALLAAVPAAGASERIRGFSGPIHEHTAYSDGEPGTRPADAFAKARSFGNDFMALTEHSDTNELPIVTNTDCISPQIAGCAVADQQNPADSFRKWDAMREQTDAATDGKFTGIRGFEWTNDRHGHLNVLFSTNYTNAKRDGGYVDMAQFWSWFSQPAEQGGGSDGLAIFNHPGVRTVGEVVPGGFLAPADPGTPQPGTTWDDLEYVASADERMVGMEVFNGGSDYGAKGGAGDLGWYAQALDRGWHVGAVGAEDTATPKWGTPEDPKTVILAPRLDRSALRSALAARRFYAISRQGVRLRFRVDHKIMGSRLRRAAGRKLAIRATTNASGAKIELVTSGGATVAGGGRSLSLRRRARVGEKWYFVRVRDARGRPIAYSSPIWVNAAPPSATGAGR